MNATFFERLERRAREADSLLCVGLDPHPHLLSADTAAAARDFCLNLVERCAPYACAFKPNIAFFEALGLEGLAALEKVIEVVPEEIPVVLDAKRGDIASTAEAYAKAVFDVLGVEAVTASPYLGRDSLEPFLARPERGVFILCKTSNPGSDDFQSLSVTPGDFQPLYLRVAAQAQAWNRHDNVGLVVGATDPVALAKVRAAAPDLWFLAPGVGAQGGNLEEALAAGLRPDGMGMLVTVSRSIATAQDPGQAAAELRDAINQAKKIYHGGAEITEEERVRRDSLSDHSQDSAPFATLRFDQVSELAAALLEAECIRCGQFTLKSGQQSPIYLDLRRLASHPAALRVVAAAFVQVMRGLKFDHLAAIPYGGFPIGTAISLAADWPMIYPRQEVKQYGSKSAVEGVFQPGETAVVVDDLVTTGGSKREAIEKLTAAGLKGQDVVVLIDREQGASKLMAKAGYRLHAVVALHPLLEVWRESGAITAEQYVEVKAYLG